MDRLLDETGDGVFYLRQPAVADMVVEAIHYNASTLGYYSLHVFVNHVSLTCYSLRPVAEIHEIVERHQGQAGPFNARVDRKVLARGQLRAHGPS